MLWIELSYLKLLFKFVVKLFKIYFVVTLTTKKRVEGPYVILEDLMQQVKEKVCYDRRVTFYTLKESFLHISQSLLGDIIS